MGRFASAALVLFLLSAVGASSSPLTAAPAKFADTAFQQLWERTDAPVAAGQVQRSWYWGPAPAQTLNEPYSGGKAGTRLVQYFDKARMEVNNPQGDRKSEWFVTTGLLVAEMVAGKQQTGDKEFKVLRAAEIAVGGDGLATDPDAPTYTSFRRVASIIVPGANRAPKRTGQAATATIDRTGEVGDEPSLGLYPGARLAAYSEPLGHNIPQAMWDFLNLKGTVRKSGADVPGQTLANWVYVMGYPITEPYWARVKISGIYQDVLFQLYERRSLAYAPAMPKGWQVQMGNVGQHYYTWVYGGSLPAPLVPPAAPPPNLPAAIDATITPLSAPVGTPFFVSIKGFASGEDIVSWFTAPDGAARDARFNLTGGPDGMVAGLTISTIGMAPGVWAITYHGKQSNHESIAYFVLTPAGSTPTATSRPSTPGAPTRTATRTPLPRSPVPASPTPTFPAVPTEPPDGLLMSVRPGSGPPGGQFTFVASGLTAGEQVQVKFTDPTGTVVYPRDSNGGQYTAAADGTLQFTLQPDQDFPSAPLGTWLWELKGFQSSLEGVVGFTLR
ncbi:MAG: hypothetical protein ACJ78Q_16325 [Chloroflexia bacterium]